MKPKPFVALNHLTVPVVILTSPRGAKARRARTSFRAGLIRFQRCLGEVSRFGAINKQIDYSNGSRVPRHAEYSKRLSDPVGYRHQTRRRPDQPSRLICSSVTTRSTFSVLLLMR